ncbi:addiction module protein [Polaromonas sp. C04]|uniref:addiction module protein n=1 Tax=Polaromonas sp. C04 TaxID=1945857 RepID=UPI000985C279|nr:addiction module protein [Polaromonas sp. C04]OOG56143.1 addiction module antitoxin RelB [Polaromonas sp. C04]
MNIEVISREALHLSAKDRATLAEQLLSSLDTLTEPEIEQLWFAQAARRAQDIDEGRVQRIPAEQVRQEGQALLR